MMRKRFKQVHTKLIRNVGIFMQLELSVYLQNRIVVRIVSSNGYTRSKIKIDLVVSFRKLSLECPQSTKYTYTRLVFISPSLSRIQMEHWFKKLFEISITVHDLQI